MIRRRAVNRDAFITTRPACSPCPGCGRLIITGIEGGLPYRVDPIPITVHAELRVRLAGRRSFWTPTAGRIAFRSPERIAADATRGRGLVLADHRCRAALPPAEIDTAAIAEAQRLITATTRPPASDDPEPVVVGVLELLNRHLGARVLDLDTSDAPF